MVKNHRAVITDLNNTPLKKGLEPRKHGRIGDNWTFYSARSYLPHKKMSDFVFPSSLSASGHIVNVYKHIEYVRERSSIYFTLHDLCRTFITLAESLDISQYTLKRLLNHKIKDDVTAGYIVFDVERLRGAMQKITDHILTMAEPSPVGRIVQISSYKTRN